MTAIRIPLFFLLGYCFIAFTDAVEALSSCNSGGLCPASQCLCGTSTCYTPLVSACYDGHIKCLTTPMIHSITPEANSAQPGDQVTVTGRGFQSIALGHIGGAMVEQTAMNHVVEANGKTTLTFQPSTSLDWDTVDSIHATNECGTHFAPFAFHTDSSQNQPAFIVKFKEHQLQEACTGSLLNITFNLSSGCTELTENNGANKDALNKTITHAYNRAVHCHLPTAQCGNVVETITCLPVGDEVEVTVLHVTTYDQEALDIAQDFEILADETTQLKHLPIIGNLNIIVEEFQTCSTPTPDSSWSS